MPEDGIEIERTFLLERLPTMPDRAQRSRIEQGYLPQPDHPSATLEGRLRRQIQPDGTVVLTHTIKQGVGLVRSENERTISVEEFEAHWPQTVGRRLGKTRYCLDEDGLPWMIDDFDDLDLVLAEVELPSPDTHVEIPGWLSAHIVRDVTEEPEYRNYALAVRAGLFDTHR